MGLLDQTKEKLGLLMQYIDANTPRRTTPAVSPAHVIDQGLFDGNANRLTQRAKEAPSEVAALFKPGSLQQLNQMIANPPKPDKQQWLDAGMELSGAAPLGGLIGATVYHGSPHKFDKFDMSKIGTGEGAQAYGHGLYFAESPTVANEYAGSLSAARSTKPVGNVDLTQAYQNLPNDVPDTLLAARRDFRNLQGQGVLSTSDRRDFLDAVKNNIVGAQGGNMYKVDIPDESIPRMLDWDKPLSEQHPDVQAALGKYANSSILENQPKPLRGADIYSSLRLGDFPDDAAASEMLKQAGIPGIRYLDGNSRGTGGTSNFVLFDDQMPRILETNGQPTGLLSYADEAAKKTKKK